MGGQLVDFIIALTLVEAMGLVAYHRITQRGLALKDYGLNLAAGLFLMLALRAALTHSLAHSNWMWIAANLSAAGLAHAADILLRFNRRNRRNH